MSDFRAVAAMTQTLRNILEEAISEDFYGAQVRVDRPQRESPHHAGGLINIFLYQVEPNPSWRNMELPVRAPDGSLINNPQAALDLHYLLSFYGEENQMIPQLLLGKTVSVLHAFPNPSRRYMPRPPPEEDGPVDRIYKLWESGLQDQAHLLRLVPMNLSHDEVSKLWTIFFQVPYNLSVVYRCSVILIEPEGEIPQPGLPVRESVVHSASVDMLPEITQVVPQVLEPRRGVRVLLRGRHLDAATGVLVGGQEARIRTASSASLLIDLPAGLPAGVVTVLAVRDVELGQPPTPHRLYESNPASFVLRPRILEPPIYDAQNSRVRVRVAPEARAGQQPALLLNQIDEAAGQTPESYTLAAEAGASGSELRFPASAVGSGTYLARVRLSGVSSALAVDHDPESPTYEQYVGPKVVFP